MASENPQSPQPNINTSDPQIATLTLTNIRPEVPQMQSLSPQYGNPVAQEIMKNLKSAQDPLAFINQNLKAKDSGVDVQRMVDDLGRAHISDAPRPDAPAPIPPNLKAPEPVAAPPSEPPPQEDKTILPAPDPFAEPKKDDAPPAEGEPPAQEFTSDVDLEEADKSSIQTSYKNLLKKHREREATFRQIEEEKKKLETKLKKIETGEELPEVVKHLEERVAQLEPLEALVDLKKSPAYQDKFVKPLNSINEKLTSIAKDYEIPEEVMNEALELKNGADLNRFLSEHFDAVGALEVKQLVSDAQRLKDAAAQAEAKPKQALSQLQEEHAHLKQIRDAERSTTIANKSRSAWERAVVKIQQEGRVQELTPRPNDTLFNDTYVKPIMQRAAQEYGRVVRTLAENGLEELPDELAEALANSCLLSIASAVAVERANATEEYANTLYQNTQRRNGMIRPSMGSTASMGAPAPVMETKPSSPLEAGRLLANRILSMPS